MVLPLDLGHTSRGKTHVNPAKVLLQPSQRFSLNSLIWWSYYWCCSRQSVSAERVWYLRRSCSLHSSFKRLWLLSSNWNKRDPQIYRWKTTLILEEVGEQIVGRERRERVSHHNWSGDA